MADKTFTDTITIDLTIKQCDLIALALDGMLNRGNLSDSDCSELTQLFFHFDTLSNPEEPTRVIQKISRPQLVYDREAKIMPFFPK